VAEFGEKKRLAKYHRDGVEFTNRFTKTAAVAQSVIEFGNAHREFFDRVKKFIMASAFNIDAAAPEKEVRVGRLRVTVEKNDRNAAGHSHINGYARFAGAALAGGNNYFNRFFSRHV
jgi:hypothetical protein